MADRLIDTIQVEQIHDWEVRYLCMDCEHMEVYRLPAMEIVNLGVSTAPRARICQNCNRPAGYIRTGSQHMATRRINEIAIGTPRALTPNESARLELAIEMIDAACIKSFEKRFLRGIDRLVGLFVERFEFKGLTFTRAYQLVPKDLKQMIDDLDTVYFNKNVSRSGRLE